MKPTDTSNRPLLSCAESCVPGDALGARLSRLSDLGLAVEAEHREGADADEYRRLAGRFGVAIATVQAYGAHDYHPLHPDARVRERALSYLEEVIVFARAVACDRVLTVCGFGHGLVDSPFERALDFFAVAAPLAAERGVRILIEPLSAQRAAALSSPGEVIALLDALGREELFGLALDTGHVADDGRDPSREISRCQWPIVELQLRGADSRAPSCSQVACWIGALQQPPEVIALEFRERLGVDRMDHLAQALLSAFAA